VTSAARSSAGVGVVDGVTVASGVSSGTAVFTTVDLSSVVVGLLIVVGTAPVSVSGGGSVGELVAWVIAVGAGVLLFVGVASAHPTSVDSISSSSEQAKYVRVFIRCSPF
jgi:zinc transporter ZupT